MILDKILQAVPGITKVGDKGWYYFPKCLVCGRPKKMCFKDPTGFKCWSARCGAKGSIPQLIRILRTAGYNIDIPATVSFISSVDMGAEEKPQPIDIPLPKEMITITPSNIPTYLTKTRLLSPKNILRFEMGYCETGDYKGRIIIPVKTKAHQSFIAYAVSRSPTVRKVLYPKGCQMDKFLWPYNYVAAKRPRKVVIVEGLMDALRIFEHGHEAFPLALLGSNISSHQTWLLFRLMTERANDITICLDSDANAKAEAILKRISSVIGYSQLYQIMLSSCPKDIQVKLQERKPNATSIDPDDILSAKDWARIFEGREQRYWLKTAS